MRLEQLVFLLEIAKTKSISLAANNCHISHSAVSKSIKALEEELGVRLLERQTKGVRLTQTARFLLPHARQIVQNVDAIPSLLRQYQDHGSEEYSGRFIIAATPPIIDTILQSILKKFQDRYPDLHIDLHVISQNDHEDLYTKPLGDLTFLSNVCDTVSMHTTDCARQISPQLRQETLFRLNFSLVMKKDSAYARKRVLSVRNTRNAKYIFNYFSRLDSLIFSREDFARTRSKILLKSDNIDTIKKFIRNFDAFYLADSALVRLFFAAEEDFRIIPVKDLICQFSALYSATNPYLPLIQEIIKECREIRL